MGCCARVVTPLALLVCISVVPIAAACAQGGRDPRLQRLDSATRVAVSAVVDSARAARLPTEPLVHKALEGTQKNANDEQIVSAVRSLSVRLRQAREALGASTSPDEIAAGANALHAGLESRHLSQLRAAAQRAGRRRVTLPLTVATDLVAHHVPVASATEIVLSLTVSGARDSDLTLFQRNVRSDVDRGADAETAAQTRARGVIAHSGRTS
jgi:hypothetical protein